MKWDENYSSSEVDDRRSERGPGGGGGGGLGLIVRLFTMFGWRGALVGLVIAGAAVVGTQFMGGDDSTPSGQYQGTPAEEREKHLVAFVFDDVQTTWRNQLPGYRDARLELFHGSLASACGTATEAVGPFYCPNDREVYVDLAFYEELRRRFGAPGEFAEAYVIAHEVGHHVQNQRGLLGGGSANSVHVELQADCLAGAWAKDASRRGIVEVGDVDQALNAAAQIGDDAIQRRETGRVRPETFKHGSSAQRTNAFRTGLQGGATACGI